MADIINNNNAGQKNRTKKVSTRVDLTPMVDLAFLLISFFMLTTSLAKEKALVLNMPDDSGEEGEISECQVINLYADYSNVYYTEGLAMDSIKKLNSSGKGSLAEVIIRKTGEIKTGCLNSKGKPRKLVCIIKLMPDARYKAMVELLDQMEAYDVPVYAIQEHSPEEEAMITEYRKTLLADANVL